MFGKVCTGSTAMLALCAIFATSITVESTKTMRIALIPKSVDNPFFDISRDGCFDAAATLTRANADLEVICNYTGPPAAAGDIKGEIQSQIMQDIVENHRADAIAVSVGNVDLMTPIINDAVRQGIPVVTFDSDASESSRLKYIGTDNYFFGTQIAKLLQQLQPNGGTFGVIASLESPNLQLRASGFVEQLVREEGSWTPVPLVENRPLFAMDVKSNITLAVEHLFALGNLDPPPTAIAPVMGMPMRSCCWKEFVDTVARDRGITLVSGDALPNQIEFLERGYVQGLVGQLPYDFGSISVITLFEYWMQNQIEPVGEEINLYGEPDGSDVIGTNVLTLVQVPLVLPPLTVDHNLLDTFNLVGFILSGIVLATASAFGLWVFVNRSLYVVKVAQPGFLIMVAAGTMVMASALIPLSFDDNFDRENYEEIDRSQDRLSTFEATAICMSVPWLTSTGFTITFSALFSKTWRVNSMFRAMANGQNRNDGEPRRILISATDVLIPFVILLTLNTIVLTLWTILDPLMFVRQDLPGTDGWNRVIATYGSCRSDSVEYYLVPLAVINLSVLVMANWQAYRARQRNIQSEFAESKYIGIAMGSLLQAIISGIPILFVVRDNPQAFYLVLCFMIFIICAVVLLVIFVPKMALVQISKGETQDEQKERIVRSMIDATKGSKGTKSRRESSENVSGARRPPSLKSGQMNFSNKNRLSSWEDEPEAAPQHSENGLERKVSFSARNQDRRSKNGASTILDRTGWSMASQNNGSMASTVEPENFSRQALKKWVSNTSSTHSYAEPISMESTGRKMDEDSASGVDVTSSAESILQGRDPSLSPQSVLDVMWRGRGYSRKLFPVLDSAYYSHPTPIQVTSFHENILELVRQNNQIELQALLREEGMSNNPSNHDGFTMIHEICRQGNADMLKMILTEFGGNSNESTLCLVQIADSQGRTPMHYSCMGLNDISGSEEGEDSNDCSGNSDPSALLASMRPRFDVIETLAGLDRRLFCLQDIYGKTPLAYVPKEQWCAWQDFLYVVRDKYWPRRLLRVHGEEAAPPLTQKPPNSRPFPHPSVKETK